MKMNPQDELKTAEQVIDNPLNALKVYAPFKRFRDYFILVCNPNLHIKIQRSVGQRVVDTIIDCEALLPYCQFGKRQDKLNATEEFLKKFAFILAEIEFITMNNVGVSVRQVTELVMLIKEIRAQMGGFRKYLVNGGDCQNPQPTGEGSE